MEKIFKLNDCVIMKNHMLVEKINGRLLGLGLILKLSV